MISRRSGGDADYVAGVRACLTERNAPPPGSSTFRGYRDAHDMVAYLSEVAADLRAEVFEEEAKIYRQGFDDLRCSTNGRDEEIRKWVQEHPEIKSKIEERLRKVPEANREQAFINAAKTAPMNQTVRPNGVRV